MSEVCLLGGSPSPRSLFHDDQGRLPRPRPDGAGREQLLSNTSESGMVHRQPKVNDGVPSCLRLSFSFQIQGFRPMSCGTGAALEPECGGRRCRRAKSLREIGAAPKRPSAHARTRGDILTATPGSGRRGIDGNPPNPHRHHRFPRSVGPTRRLGYPRDGPARRRRSGRASGPTKRAAKRPQPATSTGGAASSMSGQRSTLGFPIAEPHVEIRPADRRRQHQADKRTKASEGMSSAPCRPSQVDDLVNDTSSSEAINSGDRLQKGAHDTRVRPRSIEGRVCDSGAVPIGTRTRACRR